MFVFSVCLAVCDISAAQSRAGVEMYDRRPGGLLRVLALLKKKVRFSSPHPEGRSGFNKGGGREGACRRGEPNNDGLPLMKHGSLKTHEYIVILNNVSNSRSTDLFFFFFSF